jgi:cytochrome c-type protein NapC
MNDQQPSRRRRWLLGASLGAAATFFIAGIVFWGGFNTAMEATNEMEFCISCHEMRDNVYAEYVPTIHYNNRSGVRATCPDCHVPDPWMHKVVRKIQASNEVFHWLRGSVDTPEKFDARRLHLAKRVWTAMKATDSRECRNCHNFESMGPASQQPRSRKQHLNAFKIGQTCIDCHKGIAHKDVRDQLTDAELEALEAPDPRFIRTLPAAWAEFDNNGGKLQPVAAPAATPAAAAPAPAASEAVTPAPAAAPAATAGAAAGAADGIDWSDIASRQITLFYPGQSSMEWTLNGRDHGGARAFEKAGDRCFDCHDEEAAAMGAKIVSGEKLEPQPIPGKRGSIPVTVQAAYDDARLHLRFQWPDAGHAPVPFADGGKLDPDNQVKLTAMFLNDEVAYADRAGCWGTCHHDLRTMPDAPDPAARDASAVAGRLDLAQGVTKYLEESRSEIEIRGRDGAPRGGWDKLKDDGAIQAELAAGHFADLLRFKSGDQAVEEGYVLDQRRLQPATGATATASLEGGTWTVVLSRPLAADRDGGLSLAPGQVYNFSFAIHDDYSNARYHHVSLGYRLGFDDAEAEVVAVRK